jgi:Response regulator of citrate/malate metabolism
LESFKPHILIISRVNNIKLINELYNYGIVDYLLKPFLLETLAEKILDLKNNDNFYESKIIEEVIKKLNDLGVYTNFKGYRYIYK